MNQESISELPTQVWKKAIDVQMHFNDLIMRNRTIAISFVTAVFGGAAYSLSNKGLILHIFAFEIHISVLIILFGMLFIAAYAYLDIKYHLRLLIGAVKFTEEMDSKYKELGLTTKISNEIKHKDAEKVLFRYYLILLSGALVVFLFIILFYRT